RPRRATCGAWCTRGWWTAPRSARRAGAPRRGTPTRCASCSTSARAGTRWPAAGSRARRPRSPRPVPRSPSSAPPPSSAAPAAVTVVISRRLGSLDRVNVIRLIEVRESELSVDEVRAAVADPAAGGIALFAGAVRDSDHDRGVSGLSYSAHPSAVDKLRRVAEVIAEKYPVIGIAAVHRVGDLGV